MIEADTELIVVVALNYGRCKRIHSCVRLREKGEETSREIGGTRKLVEGVEREVWKKDQLSSEVVIRRIKIFAQSRIGVKTRTYGGSGSKPGPMGGRHMAEKSPPRSASDGTVEP